MQDLEINLNVIAKEALGTLKNIEGHVKTNTFSFSKLGATIVTVNSAMQIAGRVWSKFSGSISQVIDLASIQQKAMNDLTFAFQSAGLEGDTAAQEFALFAGELQKVTKFGDEVTMSAGALFTQLTKVTGEGLQQATIAAQNLSSTIGIDLESAMRMIAKSTEDGGSALRRYGVSVEKGKTEAESLANAVNAINNVMGGKAQADMNTFIGLQSALKNAYGDLKEQIGFTIIENQTLISIFQMLVIQMQLVPVHLQNIRNWLLENEVALKNSVIALGSVATAYGLYVLWANKATIATYAMATAKKAWIAIMALSPIGLVTIAVGALTSAVFLLTKHWDYVTANVKIFFGYLLSGLMPAIQLTMSAIGALVGIFNNALAESIEARKQDLILLSESMIASGNEQLLLIEEQNLIKEEKEQLHQDNLLQIKTDARITTHTDFQTAELKHNQAMDKLKTDAQKKDIKATEETKIKLADLNTNYYDYLKEELFTYKKFEELTNKERVDNQKSTLNSISSLSQANNKTLKAIGKAAAITTATIDGIVAVQKALASAPPPFNFALAGLVGVASATNVAKISGIPLAKGGIVQPRAGGVSATLAEAGKPEAVIPLDDRRAKKQLSGLGGGLTVVIQGNVIGDTEHIDELAKKLSDAVRFRNIELLAS